MKKKKMKSRDWRKIRDLEAEIMASSGNNMSEKKAHIVAYLEEYVERVTDLIDGITAEEMVETGAINPYLAALLRLDKLEELIEFFLLRRVERSIGTSFGNVIEYVFRALLGGLDGKEYFKQKGAPHSLEWIKWWDIVIPEKNVVISVKSGPADMDADQVRYLYDKMVEAERHGWIPFLFLTYGKKPWNVIPNTLKKKEEAYRQKYGKQGLKRVDILENDNWKEYVIVGKEIFKNKTLSKLLPNDVRDYEQLLEIFQGAGKRVGDIMEKIDAKKEQIAQEIKEKYTEDVDSLLRKHLM